MIRETISKAWVGPFALMFLSVAIAAVAAEPNGALPLTTKADSSTTATALLNPSHPVWATCTDHRLQLNRTPPLYVGDPLDDDTRPTATVRLVRIANGAVVLRTHWSDATENRATGGALRADAGKNHIYRQHTEQTNAFADAFCAMAPVKRGPSARYPSMMMGDAKEPVELYFWRAGSGFQLLSGHGRATTAQAAAQATDKVLVVPPGQAIREGDGWTLTMAIAGLTPGTPLCFAIWDGAREQRDGLKYFSLWYEVR